MKFHFALDGITQGRQEALLSKELPPEGLKVRRCSL